jgi:hypothetical protein
MLMQTNNAPDRLAMRVWLMLVILGAFLSAVAWYRYFN